MKRGEVWPPSSCVAAAEIYLKKKLGSLNLPDPAWRELAEGVSEVVLDGPVTAMESADYAWTMYNEFHNSVAQGASLIVKLNDAMNDVRSWLRGYDWEHGTMPYQRDDDLDYGDF